MKSLDILIQKWRIRKALRFIEGRARVIDIGAHKGELFEAAGSRLKEGFGIEPILDAGCLKTRDYIIKKGWFPQQKPDEGGWDCITMLAVLEHIPKEGQIALSQACHDLLRQGGRVIITVPSFLVDYILKILGAFHLIDGMSLHEHWGFKPADSKDIFCPPKFKLVHHERFQLGLNHLFVFEKNE
jgi:hypothetical protein